MSGGAASPGFGWGRAHLQHPAVRLDDVTEAHQDDPEAEVARFEGAVARAVEEMIESLARIESETDELAEKATRKLFALEAEIGVGTVFWYQMIGWIGDLADYAERVGNRLRLLIAN